MLRCQVPCLITLSKHTCPTPNIESDIRNYKRSKLIVKKPTDCRYVSNSPEQSTSSERTLDQTLISFKYLRLIKKAIREFGPIVEKNKKLEYLLQKAKEHNLPPDYIDYVQRICVDSRSTVGLLELLLFHNCHFIVQYEDIDLSLTKHHLLKLCERADAFIIQNNIKWPQNFDQKGIILVKNDSTCSTFKNLKETEIVASNVGAVTVSQDIDPEGFPYWKFLCEPCDLHEVKKHLIEKGCLIEEAFVGYIPKQKVTLPYRARNHARQVIMELNKIPCIDNVYTNIM
ncbi:translational activator of cytochrome c oxidase 1 [Nephila pilipes]|uniref:Translational activator of cytochrome c oxidase 1 n=1 Tax=Nephila pilipes TaxID=299642 RepID=A0A8X6Q9B8_NEPPI|nr:translational activator of cytochrome c oxidase 1 [Nephila pilipes]